MVTANEQSQAKELRLKMSNSVSSTVNIQIKCALFLKKSLVYFVILDIFKYVCFDSILCCVCVFSCVYRDKHRFSMCIVCNEK